MIQPVNAPIPVSLSSINIKPLVLNPSEDSLESVKNKNITLLVDSANSASSSPSVWHRLSSRLKPIASKFNVGGWPSSPKVELISIESKILSYLIENKKDAKVILEKLYGKRLIEQILTRYAFQDKETFTEEELKIIAIGISVHVKMDDLKELHQKLSKPEENSLFEKVLSSKELKKMRKIAQRDFDSLEDNEIAYLVSFFRERKLIGERITPYQLLAMNNKYKPFLTSKKEQECLTKDFQLLKKINEWNKFRNEENPDLAIAEYLGRSLASGALLKGMILPCPVKNSGEPTFLKVENQIDERGFACFLLKGISPKTQHNVMFLARGTNPRDKASLANNLGPVSGFVAYKDYKSTIKAWIEEAYDKANSKINLDFIGYSQGGAIAQLTTTSFVKKLAKKLKTSPTYKPKINNVRLLTWNSPAVLKKDANFFADCLEFFEKDPRTNHLFFEINYARVDYDIIQKFGETFIGFNRKSHNVDCSVTYYPAVSYAPIIGPHNSSNLLADKPNQKPSRKYIDRRQDMGMLKKQITYLEWLAFSSKFEQNLSTLAEKLESKEQKELIETLREMSKEQLESLTDNFASAFKDFTSDKETLNSIIELLLAKKGLEEQIFSLKTFIKEQKIWIQQVEELSLAQLEEALNKHQNKLKDEEASFFANAKALNDQMVATYAALPHVIQATMKPVASIIKGAIYRALAPAKKAVS